MKVNLCADFMSTQWADMVKKNLKADAKPDRL